MIKMMVVLDGGDVDMYKYCLYTMEFSKQHLPGASSLVLSFISCASLYSV